MGKTYTYTLSKGEFVGGRNSGSYKDNPTFSLYSGYYRLGTAANGSTNYGYQYCINAPFSPSIVGRPTSIKLTVTHSKMSYDGQWKIAYKNEAGTVSFTYTDKMAYLPLKSSTTNTIDLTSHGVPTYGVLLYQDSKSYAQQFVDVTEVTLTIVTDAVERSYEIHYSTKNWYSGTASNMVLTATDSYYAGQQNSSRIYGIHCLFDGLKNINPSSVRSINIYVQRIEGGSPITYSVYLAHSVLSGTIGETIDIKSNVDSSIYHTNRVVWQWKGESSDTSGVYKSTTIDASLFEALRDYGWFYTSDRSASADNLNRCINVADVYLVVETAENAYTVTFDANGGSGAPSSQIVTGSGSASVTISSAIPTRSNYLFKGWALTANASTAQYSPGQTITISANTTLYAVWALLSSKLYFDSQGGSSCPPKEVKFDEPYGDLPIPVYFGYNFLGWSPYPNRERLFITSSMIVPKPGNSIVFAQWARDCEIFIDMRELEGDNG